tara:strand:- start:1196 stop:2173 length:978 start_codon:yes stop_codon:yes gene_type:complete
LLKTPEISEALLKKMFETQNEFSSLFFDRDSLTTKEKEELTKSFSLALHSEVTDLANSINFKDHRLTRHDIDEDKILYKSIDVFRYVLAILNMWNFSPEDFVSSFWDKDMYLNTRHRMEQKVWSGQPVLLVDMDDVLNEFRSDFTSWLFEKKGVVVDPDSTEYYSTKEVKESGFLPEEVFKEFIVDRGLRNIRKQDGIIDTINALKDEGYWIQIITARPKDNLTCLYDTYYWASKCGLNFDNIDFSPEKFRWLVQKDFYDADAVVCAIDDSAKHSSEYAKHGVRVLSPSKSYNQELLNVSGVTMYNTPEELYTLVKAIGDEIAAK